jgi:hypothetical protein
MRFVRPAGRSACSVLSAAALQTGGLVLEQKNTRNTLRNCTCSIFDTFTHDLFATKVWHGANGIEAMAGLLVKI